MQLAEPAAIFDMDGSALPGGHRRRHAEAGRDEGGIRLRRAIADVRLYALRFARGTGAMPRGCGVVR